MKIVFTVNTYYPLKDGVQAVTQYLAEGLANKGHDVTVVSGLYDLSTDKEVYNNVKILRFQLFTKHTFHRGEKGNYLERIITLANESDVIINVCTQTPMTDLLLNHIDKLQCKKILYMHGIIDYRFRKEHFTSIRDFGSKIWNNIRWKSYYVKYENSFRKYDLISNLHEFDDGHVYFRKKGFDNLIVVENAVDNVFFEVTDDSKIDLPEKYAICVNNYIERKNQKMILSSFFKADTKEFGLVLIGSSETSYYRELMKLKEVMEKKYGKKKILILTEIPRNRIPYYVKNSSIYILGSKWEAYPISILEAMTCGVPFISTNVGVVSYFPGGLIIENEHQMIQSISSMISNEEKSENLGEQGYEFAIKNFRIDTKVNQLELELEKIMRR